MIIFLYKYTQLKSFHHELRLQVYMYDLIYVDTESMKIEDYLKATNFLLRNTRKCKIQDHSQNIGLDLVTYVHMIMSYILNLMKQNLKSQTTHPTIKLNYFTKIL